MRKKINIAGKDYTLEFRYISRAEQRALPYPTDPDDRKQIMRYADAQVMKSVMVGEGENTPVELGESEWDKLPDIIFSSAHRLMNVAQKAVLDEVSPLEPPTSS